MEIELQEATNEEEHQATKENRKTNNKGDDRGSFFHGLSVGLGIGCIATFVIVWISIFFTPQLASLTYENLLSIFIYPLIYLLAVGLIALTIGMVGEYYTKRSSKCS